MKRSDLFDLLTAELGMNNEQRKRRLSCRSVFKCIDSPGFWRSLRDLRTDRNMTTQQICTFITCSGVARKLESRDFRLALDRLFEKFSTQQVVTLMSYRVA